MQHISKAVLAALFLVLLEPIACRSEFYVLMTADQYRFFVSVYIVEYDHKKCHVTPNVHRFACEEYCRLYYDFVPSLPWKNAQYYNPISKQCEPIPACPTNAFALGSGSNRKCITVSGSVVPFTDAVKPTYDALFNVTIICENGRTGTFLGKTDCFCNMGWGSYSEPSMGKNRALQKCNKAMPLSAYFPNFRRIYYDEAYDNIWSFGGNKDYWPRMIQYFARYGKYRVINFFYPI